MGRVKDETVSGVKWGVIQRLTLHPLLFVLGVVLARLLSPDELGIMGVTAFFFALAAQLQSCGFGTALIQKTDRTETDINTVFWFNVTASAILSTILFLCAPLFVIFFDNRTELLNLTRVSAVMMFVSSTTSVHHTLFQCRRDFKTPAVIGIISMLVASPIAVIGAYFGLSYWALVMQGCTSSLLSLVLVWTFSPWKPRFIFSWKSFKTLFAFGSKIALTGLINSVYFNLKDLLIAKFYKPAALALYQRGGRLANMPATTINQVLESVTLPIFATIKDDNAHLFSVYQKYIAITSFGIFFACINVAALSEPFVTMVYGEQWITCYPYVQVIVFSTVVLHIAALNGNLITIKGRPDVILKLEVIKKIYSVVLIAIGVSISVYAICVVSLIGNVTAMGLNVYYTKKLFSYTVREQLSTVTPYFLYSLLSAGPSYAITYTGLPDWLQILLGGICACVIYLLAMRARKDKAFHYLLDSFKNKAILSRFPSLYRWLRGAAD